MWVELILRLLLAPLLIWLVGVLSRRLGPAAGGRLIGLPLTTGPFLVVVALTEGAVLAASAARGVVAGQISVVVFCATYARLAGRRRPAAALGTALAAGLLAAALLTVVSATWLVAAVVLGAVALALLAWPAASPVSAVAAAPRWETPMRMGVSGGLVAALSAASGVVGPQVAGVLSSTPVILSVMTPSTHRQAGAPAAVALTRGVVASMPASVLFSAVLAYTLTWLGPWPAFLLAGAVLVTTDAAIRWARRWRGPADVSRLSAGVPEPMTRILAGSDR